MTQEKRHLRVQKEGTGPASLPPPGALQAKLAESNPGARASASPEYQQQEDFQ